MTVNNKLLRRNVTSDGKDGIFQYRLPVMNVVVSLFVLSAEFSGKVKDIVSLSQALSERITDNGFHTVFGGLFKLTFS